MQQINQPCRLMPEWLSYDEMDQVLKIDGYQFSRELFRFFTASEPGIRVRILSRANGVITVGQERSDMEAAAPALFAALRAMTEWWAYAMAKPSGVEPSDEDHKRVEELATLAIDALTAADPTYVPEGFPNAS